jgi:hypothetical protein
MIHDIASIQAAHEKPNNPAPAVGIEAAIGDLGPVEPDAGLYGAPQVTSTTAA